MNQNKPILVLDFCLLLLENLKTFDGILCKEFHTLNHTTL